MRFVTFEFQINVSVIPSHVNLNEKSKMCLIHNNIFKKLLFPHFYPIRQLELPNYLFKMC